MALVDLGTLMGRGRRPQGAVTGELRGEFHRELDRLEIAIGGLLGLVPDAVALAADALVVPDAAAAHRIVAWRDLVDELYADVGGTIEVVLARQSPVAGDLRFLLVCVRLVPTLHEVIDLSAEVAAARRGPGQPAIDPDLAAAVRLVADEAARAWTAVGELWSSRDPGLPAVVDGRVTTAAAASAALTEQLAAGATALPLALEVAVAASRLERATRHGRDAARLIAPLAGWRAGADRPRPR